MTGVRAGTGARLPVVLVLAVSAWGCRGEDRGAPEISRADPVIPMDSALVEVGADGGAVRLNVEIAETPAQRSTGLMERRVVGESRGMLFLFEDERSGSDPFHMYRTRIPLDIAFMDSTGAIVAIRRMEPCESPAPEWCEKYSPGVPYRAALEVDAGFFERHEVDPGYRVVVVERFPGPATGPDPVTPRPP